MVRLYMDAHVPGPITRALRQRGVDVLTAQDDKAAEIPDSELLDRATAMRRVLFSQDEDLLAEAAARQRSAARFYGVIFVNQQTLSIGRCVEDLELIAAEVNP